MLTLSDKFHEEFNRMQQQFDEWTPFEQFNASVELTKKLNLSYRYFLSQILYQNNNTQQENNDMFHHTIHQANAPAILACLRFEPLDKIISTLQLYLPLVSIRTTNEKLLDAYRDVVLYLDSKLIDLTNFTYTEQQIINFCQQIKCFIQLNPCLQKILVDLPQLNLLASSTTIRTKINTDEKLSSSPPTQTHHQPLQRYSSVRLYQNTPPPPLMNFSSEGSHNSSVIQQLIHNDAGDSGIDLSEPGIANSIQNLLSTQNCQHTIIGRSHSASLTLTAEQDNQHNNHPFVVKTVSSPMPEQTASSNRSTLVPLSAVLSAPTHSCYTDYRHTNSNQQQIQPTLTINNEEKDENHKKKFFISNNFQMENFYSDMNSIDNSNRLRQFSSLRNPNTKTNHNNPANNNECVSQYLGVESTSGVVRNTFIQPNSGMRDVPKWLKNLRLHKYAFFFSQMTYDQMMNLTIEQLKEEKITDGACTKILLNIKKLKERQILLQQCLIDIENGNIDMKTVLQHLNELFLTPIRAKQTEQNNNNNDDEDLPKLIMQVLEKAYQQLTSNSSSTNIQSDVCNNLVGLFDRCYKHEAFSPEQRHTLLHWRGPLCNKLQTSGKIEFKSMQSSSTLNRRIQLKPQTSMGNMNTTQPIKQIVRNVKSSSYYPNYPPNTIPLTRQHNSEISNQNVNNNNLVETNLIRRPIKSPTLIFTTNHDTNDDSTNHLSIVSSQSLQEQTTFITERSGNGTGNLRPSFNYLTSTPQRNNNTYLSTNQHQLLTRKTSIDPYGETNLNDKTKLCKTFSDPNKIRFYNQTQISPQQTTSYRMLSTTYQPRQHLSNSPPTQANSNYLFDSESSIEKSYSENENSNSTSNENNIQDVEHVYNQRHNIAEFEKFCRQITESAISDDVQDTSIDRKNIPLDNQNLNSTDTEQ